MDDKQGKLDRALHLVGKSVDDLAAQVEAADNPMVDKLTATITKVLDSIQAVAEGISEGTIVDPMLHEAATYLAGATQAVVQLIGASEGIMLVRGAAACGEDE